jgi:hypothetical protein
MLNFHAPLYMPGHLNNVIIPSRRRLCNVTGYKPVLSALTPAHGTVLLKVWCQLFDPTGEQVRR